MDGGGDMRKEIIEGKSLEEVQKLAQERFNEPLERLKINIISEKKGFLGIGAQLTAEVSYNVNPKDEGLNYLKRVLKAMGIEANIEVFQQKNHIRYSIHSQFNPLLIGNRGRTIEALQTLVRQVISKYSDEHLICTVDVGGYKEKRKLQLEILATKTAKEVARTKIEAKLDPMNSYERRIIHAKLADWRDVYTESVGEEPNRSVVIKPRKKR